MRIIDLNFQIKKLIPLAKVNRDRYNIDAPGCKKKAYMDLDFRTLNGSEI